MTSKRKSSQLARHAAAIAVAAPQVVAARMLRMALAGPNPSARDRREFSRMHAEKAEAFQEGWLAVWGEAMRWQQRTALDWMAAGWLGKPATLALPDAAALCAAALAPVRRRAVANARRLGGSMA